MKNYFLILKLLIKDMLKRRDKKQKMIFILLGVLYFFMAMFVVTMVIVFSSVFLEAGKEVELIGLILFVDFIMTIIFGLITSISYLFMSKDTDFFKALPVKPSAIFMAKLLVVFLTEAAVSAAILLPALVAAGIFLQLPWLFFVLIPIFILCVPVLSMVVISLLSFPLMYIISLFKNRSVAASIAVILAFATFFTLYMVFMTSSQNISDQSMQRILSVAESLSFVVYPVYMLAKFAALTPVFGLPLAASLGVSLAIFVGSLAALVLLSYFLSSLAYNKITGRLLESRAGRVKKGEFISSSHIVALMKNEWRGIIRNPMVAMQVVSGVLLCPIVVAVFCVIFGNTAQMLSDPEIGLNFDMNQVVWIFSIMALLMFGVGQNQGAVTCISREGKGINYLKGMPLAAADIIKAKKLVYLLTQGAAIITGLIAMVVVMIVYNSFVWWVPVGCGAVTISWLIAMTNLAIYWDLKNPRFDWKSQREVLKRGKNNLLSMIWMFSSMTMCFALFGFVIAGVVADASVIILAGFVILTAAGVGAAFGFRYLLNKNAQSLFAGLKA